jgi:phosphoribosylformylglycinamidine cyclo-ligase
MLRTFNCGVGMIVVAAPEDADVVEAALNKAGMPPIRLGAIVPQQGSERVTYRGALAL